MLTMHEYGVLVGALLLVLEPVLLCVLPHRDELESTFYIYIYIVLDRLRILWNVVSTKCAPRYLILSVQFSLYV